MGRKQHEAGLEPLPAASLPSQSSPGWVGGGRPSRVLTSSRTEQSALTSRDVLGQSDCKLSRQMSRVIWVYSGAILPDYRQRWTDYRVPQTLWSLSGGWGGGGGLTLLCGGDLPSFGVDLEEVDIFVGDLADQGVGEYSVGGRGVVQVRGEDADKGYTWGGGQGPGL